MSVRKPWNQEEVDKIWGEYSFTPTDIENWVGRKKLEYKCSNDHIFEGKFNGWKSRFSKIPCPHCRYKIRREKFLKDLKVNHKNSLKPLSSFINARVKVAVECQKCEHVWSALPRSFRVSSCPKCMEKQRVKKVTWTKEQFINKCPRIKTGEYNILGIYKNTKTKVLMRHNYCGHKWKVLPKQFKDGSSCPICSNFLSNFKKSDWVKKGNESLYYDSFKIYIIRCWNLYEEFIKIGRTFVKVNQRFAGKKNMPYNYKVIKVLESDDGDYIWGFEYRIHKKFKAFSYHPAIFFKGEGECYSLNILDYINYD